MATQRNIFGLWDCTSCYAKGIYGPARHCPSCGNPREADELARRVAAAVNVDRARFASLNVCKVGRAEEGTR